MHRKKGSKTGNLLKSLYIPQMIFPAGFLTVFLSLLWTPADYSVYDLNFFLSEKVTSFTRGIGEALMNGFDIAARVKNMTFYAFLYLPLLFAIIYGAICFLLNKRKNDIKDEEYRYINTLTWVSTAALLIQLFNRLNLSMFNNSIVIPPIMIASTILYMCVLYKKIPFESFKWSLLAALALEIPAIVLLYELGIEISGNLVPIIVTGGMYALSAVILLYLLGRAAKKQRDAEFCASFTPMMAAPIALSIFLELANVLNQYEIFIYNKIEISLLLFILSSALCIVLYRKYIKSAKKHFDIIKWQYPLLILSLSLLMVQPSMQFIGSSETFETSNQGCTIAGLFQYGQIPLLENLDVHMFSYSFGGIVYGWLNNNAIAAVYAPYLIFAPLEYLLWYFLLKRITNPDVAAMLAILFPISGLFNFLDYYGIGLMVVLAAVRVYEKRNKRSMLLFCLACLFACLYKMDMVMFVISSVVVLTIIFIAQKQTKPLLRLWVTGICTVAAFLGTFMLLCIVKGINPLARLVELVSILMSNINWAYDIVADYSQWYYFLCYLVVPVSLIACVIAAFVNWKKGKKECASKDEMRKKSIPFLIIAILVLAFVVNFQRTIVRHNVAEKAWNGVLSVAPLCICLTCFILSGKRTNVLIGCLTGAIFLPLVFGQSNLSGSTLMQASLKRQLDSTMYESYSEKVDRLIVSKSLQNGYIKPIKELLDATLEENETFFDFSTNSLLYALTEREKPVYVNQSPSQLNGEYTQLLFINEIESADCPYAITLQYDYGFDGVPVCVNQYLVAEYLNKNYKPLCNISGYRIWARKDCYEQKKTQIESLAAQAQTDGEGESVFSNINWIDYMSEASHAYDIMNLAYYWGTYDKAEPQKLQRELATGLQNVTRQSVDLDFSSIDMSQGNYIEITADSSENGIAYITVSGKDDGDIIDFRFNTVSGVQNRYLIRVSCDYLWYSGLGDTLTLSSDTELSNVSIRILQGDVDYANMNILQTLALKSMSLLN